jgi:hypothetical protein
MSRSVGDHNDVGDRLGMNPNEKAQRSKAIRSQVGVKGIILRVGNMKNIICNNGPCVKPTMSALYGDEIWIFIPYPQPCGEKLDAMRVSAVGDHFTVTLSSPTERIVAYRNRHLGAFA